MYIDYHFVILADNTTLSEEFEETAETDESDEEDPTTTPNGKDSGTGKLT